MVYYFGIIKKYLKITHSHAIKWLKQGLCRIYWEQLSENSHPWAIEQLQKNPEKISWLGLSQNTNTQTMKLFKYYKIPLSQYGLSANPAMFEIDYKATAKKINTIYPWIFD